MRLSILPQPYEALSWSAAPQEQQAAIANLLSHPDDIIFSLLLQPGDRKDIWESAALVLGSLDRARILPHLAKLLAWLQDLNWPGATDVFRLLVKTDPEWIGPALQVATKQAQDSQDEEWLNNLTMLAQELSDRL